MNETERELELKELHRIMSLTAMSKQIADHYGLEHQKKKAIEELAELIRAIATGTRAELIGEIADAEIMIVQIKYLLGLSNEVAEATEEKLKRQMKRIEQEEPSEAEKFKMEIDCMGV